MNAISSLATATYQAPLLPCNLITETKFGAFEIPTYTPQIRVHQLAVKFQKLDPRAITPRYGSDGAAAFDLFTYEDFELHYANPVVVNTGIAMEIPEGYGLFLFSRSSQGFKADTRLANCVGVIDSDYRGEIKVKLTKDVASWAMPSTVKAGVAIAQGVVMPYQKVTLIESDSLSETGRGSNGFGSTDRAPGETSGATST